LKEVELLQILQQFKKGSRILDVTNCDIHQEKMGSSQQIPMFAIYASAKRNAKLFVSELSPQEQFYGAYVLCAEHNIAHSQAANRVRKDNDWQTATDSFSSHDASNVWILCMIGVKWLITKAYTIVSRTRL
jgi:hypothetical protein